MWILIIIIPLFVWLDLHLFKLYSNFIFTNKEDFHNSLKYSFTPDILSLFKGKYLKDKLAEFKLSILVFSCILTIILEVSLAKAIVSLM
jgi:hypothetical protein